MLKRRRWSKRPSRLASDVSAEFRKKGSSCRESGDKTSGNIGEKAPYSEHYSEITETGKRHCNEQKK
jgi:hypothetical protein